MSEGRNPSRRTQRPAPGPRHSRSDSGTRGGRDRDKGRDQSPRKGQSRGRNDRDKRGSDGAQDSGPILHLEDDIVKELRATARPGKAEILIKVFAQAAGAFNEEDYDTAVALGEQSKHIALRSATIRELLGLAYYHSEKWKEAARELAAFKRLSGSTEQNPVIADSYRAMGRPDKALEIASEIDPQTVEPAVAYEGAIVGAGALADMKKLDEAIAHLEKLDLRPKTAEDHHLRAWYVLGDLLERNGRFTQARNWFEAVNGAGPELTDAGERLHKLRGRS